MQKVSCASLGLPSRIRNSWSTTTFRVLCAAFTAVSLFLIVNKGILSSDEINEVYMIPDVPATETTNDEEDPWWNKLQPPVPMDINQPLPQKKYCLDDLKAFLTRVRSVQKEAVEKWYKMPVSDIVKWASLPSAYDPEEIRSDMFYLVTMQGKTETESKYMLDFVKRNESSCNIVSFGIGLDYSDGNAIWQRYPQCSMTGIDPVSRGNREIVKLIPGARFFEYAIGGKDETSTGLIMKNGVYGHHKANHTNMAKVFKKVNGKKLIDLLIIDVEGAEFKFMDKFIDDKRRLPTICQLNFELHPPNMYGYNFPKSLEMVYKLLSDGTYSVFNMDIFRRYARMFLVNTENPECIKKFFCQKKKIY